MDRLLLGAALFRSALAAGGIVLLALLRVRLAGRTFREPDLLALPARHDPRYGDRCWYGADPDLEVVSPDDPARDLATKRREYAEADIPGYWIVDSRDRTVAVLAREGERCSEHEIIAAGTVANSVLFPGFAVAPCPTAPPPAEACRDS